MKKRALSIISILVLVSMLLSACVGKSNTPTPSGDNKQAAPKKDSVAIRLLSDVTTFDPAKSNDINVQMIHYQIHEGLVREEQDGSLVPALAEKWEFSSDNKDMKVTLRQGVKFQNGDPVTADDVVYSINRAIKEPFTSKMTTTLASAEKIDDKTVLIKQKFAYPAIIACLASSSLAIVPKKAVEADPKGFEKKPVGAGPYMVKEVVTGEKVVLEAFPDYYRGAAKIKTITYKNLPDVTTALVALEKGEIDMMTPSQAFTDRQAIIDNPKLKYLEADQAVYFLVGFNNSKGIFTNQKLREAVSYALDRDSIIQGAVNGMAAPVYAAMVPVIKGFYPKDFKGQEYDPAKAKQLLAAAGYPNGFTTTMKVIAAENYTKPAEIIQEQLRQVGITLKVEPMERAAWFTDVYNGGNSEIMFHAITASVLDPDAPVYSFFHSSAADGKGNFFDVKDPELDKLIDAGRQTFDPAQRVKIYTQFCEMVRDKAIEVPLFSGKRTQAINKDLKGVQADPMMKYMVYNYSW